MSWFVRGLVLVMLALAAWKVHEARARLGAGRVGDPQWVARTQQRLDRLPFDPGETGWTGRPMPLESGELLSSGGDCCVRAQYADVDRNEVVLYVAGAAHFDERFHTPNFCLTAKGWELRDQQIVGFFDVPGVDENASMVRVVVEYGHQRMIVYYWLVVGDVLMEPRWGQRLHRFLDLLAGRPLAPTYLVVVYVPVKTDVPSTERVAAGFVRAMMPHLRAATAEPE